MLRSETKCVEGVVISLLHEEGSWMIQEEEDAQTYDSYTDAKSDYDRIIDLRTLVRVFGWEHHPFLL